MAKTLNLIKFPSRCSNLTTEKLSYNNSNSLYIINLIVIISLLLLLKQILIILWEPRIAAVRGIYIVIANLIKKINYSIKLKMLIKQYSECKRLEISNNKNNISKIQDGQEAAKLNKMKQKLMLSIFSKIKTPIDRK